MTDTIARLNEYLDGFNDLQKFAVHEAIQQAGLELKIRVDKVNEKN